MCLWAMKGIITWIFVNAHQLLALLIPDIVQECYKEHVADR